MPHPTFLRIAPLVLVAMTCVAAHAQSASPQDPPCRPALAGGHPLAHRAATIASLEHLPESCLKSMLVRCSDNADERLLDLGSAALCSMGYEALLRKSFGGSFGAMLVWWQRDRDSRLVP